MCRERHIAKARTPGERGAGRGIGEAVGGAVVQRENAGGGERKTAGGGQGEDSGGEL